jgi:hypothetical protein
MFGLKERKGGQRKLQKSMHELGSFVHLSFLPTKKKNNKYNFDF